MPFKYLVVSLLAIKTGVTTATLFGRGEDKLLDFWEQLT